MTRVRALSLDSLAEFALKTTFDIKCLPTSCLGDNQNMHKKNNKYKIKFVLIYLIIYKTCCSARKKTQLLSTHLKHTHIHTLKHIQTGYLLVKGKLAKVCLHKIVVSV